MDEHPRKAELLTQLSFLNPDDGINPSWAAVMGFTLDKVVSDIANYTHLTIKDFRKNWIIR